VHGEVDLADGEQVQQAEAGEDQNGEDEERVGLYELACASRRSQPE
jgi:hypothetical protein